MTTFQLQALHPLIESLKKEVSLLGVLCYGSYAEGTQDEKSDVDLLVICKNAIPSISLRNKVYEQNHCQSIELEKSFGSWGVPAWTPSNDQFYFHQQKIGIGYNTATWVENLIEEIVDKGKITLHDFQFRPYTFLGLLDNAHILFEEQNYLTAIKKTIYPFPRKLKKALLAENLPLFEENLSDLIDISQRNVGVLAFEFYLFRAIDAAIQILFALNQVYDPSSKRIENHLQRLSKLPPNFNALIQDLLPIFFTKKKEIVQNLEEMHLFFLASLPK